MPTLTREKRREWMYTSGGIGVGERQIPIGEEGIKVFLKGIIEKQSISVPSMEHFEILLPIDEMMEERFIENIIEISFSKKEELDLSVINNEIISRFSLDKEIKELEYLYSFVQEKEVRYFLEENEFLIPFLKEAYTQIKRIFGGETNLMLMLTDDPEESFEELVIVVHIQTSVEKAIELREKLYKEWLLSVIPQLKGKLNILVEIV